MTANHVAEGAGLRSQLVLLLASSVLTVSVIRRCIIFHKIQLPKRNSRLPVVKRGGGTLTSTFGRHLSANRSAFDSQSWTKTGTDRQLGVSFLANSS